MDFQQNGVLDILGRYPNPFTGEQPTALFVKQAVCDFDSDTKQLKKCDPGAAGWSKFATWHRRYEFFQLIHTHQIILFIAGTGVGKTAIIPKLLSHYFNYQTPIICTTPRILSTISSAEYSALTMDVPIILPDEEADPSGLTAKLDENGNKILTGNLFIGYSTKDFKNHYNPKVTKIVFCTDGTVKAWILGNDPLLRNFGGIIIDEAHERNPNIDIILSLICNIARARPEFKIIIMSATVNEQLFIDFFKTKQQFGDGFVVMNMSGAPLQFPITDVWTKTAIKKNAAIDAALIEINKIIADPAALPGDILVFLKSIADITKLRDKINEKYNTYPAHRKPIPIPLYASTSQIESDMAIKKDGIEIAQQKYKKQYGIKVMLATSMAESSLTFGAPLSYVVDTGLLSEPIYHPEIDAISRNIAYVNAASIKQRCGRTGRTTAGACVHVYSEYYHSMLFSRFAAPGIVKQDFTYTLLNIMSIPANDNRLSLSLEFVAAMIEPTDNMVPFVRRAIQNLKATGLIQYNAELQDFVIAPLGEFANKWAVLGMETVDIYRIIAVAYHFCDTGYREFYLNAAYIICAYLFSGKVKGFFSLFLIPKDVPEYKNKGRTFIPLVYLDKLRDANLLHPSGEVLSAVKIIMFYNACVTRVADFNAESFAAQYNFNLKSIKDINTVVNDIKTNLKKSGAIKMLPHLPVFQYYNKPDVVNTVPIANNTANYQSQPQQNTQSSGVMGAMGERSHPQGDRSHPHGAMGERSNPQQYYANNDTYSDNDDASAYNANDNDNDNQYGGAPDAQQQPRKSSGAGVYKSGDKYKNGKHGGDGKHGGSDKYKKKNGGNDKYKKRNGGGGQSPFGQQRQRGDTGAAANPDPAKWDEFPYLSRLIKKQAPQYYNFALNKTLEYLITLLTSKNNAPLSLDYTEVIKTEPDAIWNNILFILFYGAFNKFATKTPNKDNISYCMRNSNIDVAIDNTIIHTYFKTSPDYLVYNICETREDFKSPHGIIEFTMVNAIPVDILNRYTEYPLYSAAKQILDSAQKKSTSTAASASGTAASSTAASSIAASSTASTAAASTAAASTAAASRAKPS